MVDKVRSKPNDIGYEPQLWNYRKSKEEIRLSDGDPLSIEIMEKLMNYSKEGFEIIINCGHDQNYRYHDDYESCEIWTEINIYYYDHEGFEKAKEVYKERYKKYKKDLAAYEEFLKEKKEADRKKEEKTARNNRHAEYLRLKEEFEGK